MQNLQYRCQRNIDDVTDGAIATKFGTGVVFWQVQTCAKFQCPSSAVTLFSGGRGCNAPVIESQKRPA